MERQPSGRHAELIGYYRQMHASPENIFAGQMLGRHLPTIRSLVRRHGARTLLDYGSGRGDLYSLRDVTLPDIGPIASVTDYLGVESVVCYDPGVPAFSELPAGSFDGVISTDVLEHIAEEDIPWTLAEMFGKAKEFVFANVASYPAKKKLPSGENAHVTQRDPRWWRDQLSVVSRRHPALAYHFEIKERRHFLTKIFGKYRSTVLT
jgi:hypothetical protein